MNTTNFINSVPDGDSICRLGGGYLVGTGWRTAAVLHPTAARRFARVLAVNRIDHHASCEGRNVSIQVRPVDLDRALELRPEQTVALARQAPRAGRSAMSLHMLVAIVGGAFAGKLIGYAASIESTLLPVASCFITMFVVEVIAACAREARA